MPEEPADVLRWFERISAVPRGSYNEAGIADFLVAFARERGLECYRDAADNVLIQAPATPGMENRPPLLLQGHTDMVCEKNRDVEHDFLRDPVDKLRRMCYHCYKQMFELSGGRRGWNGKDTMHAST